MAEAGVELDKETGATGLVLNVTNSTVQCVVDIQVTE